MMDTTTGSIEMLPPDWKMGDALPAHAPDNALIIAGAVDEIRELERRAKLGARELERRAARRSQQKASRRANR